MSQKFAAKVLTFYEMGNTRFTEYLQRELSVIYYFLKFSFNFRQFTFIRTIKLPALHRIYWQYEANLVIVLVLYEIMASAPLTK